MRVSQRLHFILLVACQELVVRIWWTRCTPPKIFGYKTKFLYVTVGLFHQMRAHSFPYNVFFKILDTFFHSKASNRN